MSGVTLAAKLAAMSARDISVISLVWISFTCRCGIAFVGNGIENDARQYFPLPRESNRNGVSRHLMHVIGRSIQWIDDPLIFGRFIPLVRRFLANETEVGMIGHEDRFDGFLGRQIGLGHKIGWTFFPHLKSTDPVQENLSTRPRRTLTNFDIRIHRKIHFPI
jgi:hypothetical protein